MTEEHICGQRNLTSFAIFHFSWSVARHIAWGWCSNRHDQKIPQALWVSVGHERWWYGENLHIRSEAWRIDGCHLEVIMKDKGIGWYVTIKGVRAEPSWSCFSCKHASLGVSSACWISVLSLCFLYPLLNKCIRMSKAHLRRFFPPNRSNNDEMLGSMTWQFSNA